MIDIERIRKDNNKMMLHLRDIDVSDQVSIVSLPEIDKLMNSTVSGFVVMSSSQRLWSDNSKFYNRSDW